MFPGINSSSESLLIEAKKSFENDGRLDKKEFKSLKNMINSSDLSPEAKEGAIKFLELAKKSSDGFLGIFGRGISNKELGKLKELAGSLGDNPIAAELCKTLESALAKPEVDTSKANTHKSHSSEPSTNFISRLFSQRMPDSEPFAQGGMCLNTNKNDFYVSQGNGLKSAGSDCGPSCATMVLKRFGVFDRDTTGAEGVTKIRSLLGQSNHAIDEGQIETSIENLSNGAVKKTSSSDFNSSSSLIDYAKNQLSKGAMPILLTASPYHDDEPDYDGRHYMIITGVDPKSGNIQLADPGGKYQEMTQERLNHLMNKTNRGTSVLCFNNA